MAIRIKKYNVKHIFYIEKDIFLNEWATKITNYNVDLDESN